MNPGGPWPTGFGRVGSDQPPPLGRKPHAPGSSTTPPAASARQTAPTPSGSPQASGDRLPGLGEGSGQRTESAAHRPERGVSGFECHTPAVDGRHSPSRSGCSGSGGFQKLHDTPRDCITRHPTSQHPISLHRTTSTSQARSSRRRLAGLSQHSTAPHNISFHDTVRHFMSQQRMSQHRIALHNTPASLAGGSHVDRDRLP